MIHLRFGEAKDPARTSLDLKINVILQVWIFRSTFPPIPEVESDVAWNFGFGVFRNCGLGLASCRCFLAFVV